MSEIFTQTFAILGSSCSGSLMQSDLTVLVALVLENFEENF
jgi:hypothetical protein